MGKAPQYTPTKDCWLSTLEKPGLKWSGPLFTETRRSRLKEVEKHSCNRTSSCHKLNITTESWLRVKFLLFNIPNVISWIVWKGSMVWKLIRELLVENVGLSCCQYLPCWRNLLGLSSSFRTWGGLQRWSVTCHQWVKKQISNFGLHYQTIY